jgi:hypothetical protein
MAVSDEKKKKASPKANPAPKAEPERKPEPESKPEPAEAAPSAPVADGGDRLALLGPWLAIAYVAGLVLVFLGERVFDSTDAVRYAFTGLGAGVVVAATALRFFGASKVAGERRGIELSLAKLSALGLVSLAVYFFTTEMGKGFLGVDAAKPETRARFEGAGTVVWVVLLIIAVLPLLFGERALAPMRTAPVVEERRVSAAALSGLTLAFALTYCALLTYAAGELDLKVDFSYFRTARPSDSTKNIARSITEPVKVMAFFPQLSDVGAEVDGYLSDLKSASPNLEIEVHDRLLVPALAKEAKVTQDGVIILTRGTSRETVNVGAEMKTAQTKLKSLDVDFQKSLLKILREQRTAYLTIGHGELNDGPGGPDGKAAKGLKKLLESQNYAIKDLGLAQGLANEIPADAHIVVVLGPTRSFMPEEVASIKRFADKGGKLFLALDPEAKVDLAPLADAVDVGWQPAVLAADKNYVPRRRNESDRYNLVSNVFSSHASVSTLGKIGRAPVIFPGAAALDKKKDSSAKIDFAVRALPETFNDVDNNFQFDKATEKRSSYNLAAAVSRPVPGAAAEKDKEPVEMRAFVVGDADGFSDAVLGVPPTLVHEPNVILLLDAMRWLGGEESFSGAIATTEDVRIEHTKQKDKIWFYASIFGAPLIVLGGGLGLTQRARARKKRRAS